MEFEEELKVRRAGVAAEIEALREKARALEGVLAAFDAVIAHADPDAVPPSAEGSPRRRRALAALPPELKRLNKTAAVFEILREAGQPISTAACVSAIAARQNVAANHPGLTRFSSHVSATLSGLLRRDRVRKVEAADGRGLLWEVAA